MPDSASFNTIRISLASPEDIRRRSYGEVTKPETINYRTLRPEKDGLFCEKTFGPTKDWECSCGKYKKIRYRGVKCDRCGVEVTRAKVRRERMGHIGLAAPVAHIWFAKGIPSRLALLLDLSPRNLERVLYFAHYIVTHMNEEARQQHIAELRQLLKQDVEQWEQQVESRVAEARGRFEAESNGDGDQATGEERQAKVEEEILELRGALKRERQQVEEDIQSRIDELEDLRPKQLLAEHRYRELRDRYGNVFRADMGAEALLEVLRQVDLESERDTLQQELRVTSGQRRKKAIKRLQVVEAFRKSENKPEWMILTVLPVLPPDLRPMVQLDGGRFATSDLNDLYRRVINRNNRLKRLLELAAPDIIVRNEKRMLQEAVDALIDNGRRGRAIAGNHNHKLKSLSDLLRGKQGRFRQNLLGKRVDYSGRTVIVAGPELKMHQCGLPRRMALELFKPFVMHHLVLQGYAHNIKNAKRIVERVRPEVWDILEEVVSRRPVLLNRAPTLHRLGIQAFQPILIEGSAIQVHPLVCTAFNADFDGDQMAVHVPLSRAAVLEAERVMLSTHNMLSPSSGEPIVAPTKDIVLGCFYLTRVKPGAKGEGRRFSSLDDARLAYDFDQVNLQAEILVEHPQGEDGWLRTTVGRILFNEAMPEGMGFHNTLMDKDGLKDLVAECYRELDNEGTAAVLDKIKELGFHYATMAGITFAVADIEVSPKKQDILRVANQRIEQLDEQYQSGLITAEERYAGAVSTWQDASEDIRKMIEESLPSYGGIYMMAASGARGNIANITQMAGMRGLMSNPRGQIIELPVKSSFREGLSVLEYFISTHGARKGLTDTALRTADSGYLTRRLIDVAQDVIVLEEDCGTPGGIWVDDHPGNVLLASFAERMVGRLAAVPVTDPRDGRVIVERNEEIGEEQAQRIVEAELSRVLVRSPLACQARRGICQACYGRSLATGRPAMLGEAAGIIAAQSIGEPGTQLTMRTFHTGGVAQEDITTGLPRVEELFEARSPKGEAVLTEIDGVVEEVVGETRGVADTSGLEGHGSPNGETGSGASPSTKGSSLSPRERLVRVVSVEEYHDELALPAKHRLLVAEGDWVDVGTPLAEPKAAKKATKSAKGAKGAEEGSADSPQAGALVARAAGRIHLEDGRVTVAWEEREEREYLVPPGVHIVVEGGQQVRAGDVLTAGPKNPQDILRIQGREAVQRYLVQEVQRVYRSQGVSINDKHIEITIRQMLRKVRVDTPGDTDLLPGELVDRLIYEDINAKVLAEGGEPATAQPVLLGVTRASLNTESFLAAASFQETARVLAEASVNGATDHLRGLKENVIIGRLIPARLDRSEEGRKRLGLDEPPPPVAVLSRPLSTPEEEGAEDDGNMELPGVYDLLEEAPGGL